MATYLALQCYQCNTMQAKQQQKKSGNKWTCAICNEKQSVKKVFARSGVAKDIRIFVQGFNMSAHLALQTIPHYPSNILQRQEENKPVAYESKWSEYLEGEEEKIMPSPIADNDNVIPIVTALPDPPFGKRKRQVIRATKELKLNASSTLDNYGLDVANKKRSQSSSRPSGDEVASIIGRMKKSEGCSRATQDCGKQVSKWSSYLEREAETQNESMISKSGGNENNGSTFEGIFEWQDQVVDEDVHPDFL